MHAEKYVSKHVQVHVKLLSECRLCFFLASVSCEFVTHVPVGGWRKAFSYKKSQKEIFRKFAEIFRTVNLREIFRKFTGIQFNFL